MLRRFTRTTCGIGKRKAELYRGNRRNPLARKGLRSPGVADPLRPGYSVTSPLDHFSKNLSRFRQATYINYHHLIITNLVIILIIINLVMIHPRTGNYHNVD